LEFLYVDQKITLVLSMIQHLLKQGAQTATERPHAAFDKKFCNSAQTLHI